MRNRGRKGCFTSILFQGALDFTNRRHQTRRLETGAEMNQVVLRLVNTQTNLTYSTECLYINAHALSGL